MTNLPRFSLTLEQDTVDAIESFQADNGFSTRNKAIQHLIALGISETVENAAPAISSLQRQLIEETSGMDDGGLVALINIAKRMKKEN